MPKSNANGVEIHYEVTGEGPPLVLLHAIPYDHTLWLYQAAHFSTWFKVISVDLRGWGRSEKVTTPYDFEEMSDDVIGVMDDIGADDAIVMGCSIGSKMALLLGGKYPERFQAVIQVGGNSAPQDMDRRIKGYGEEDFPPYRHAHLRYGVRETFADSPMGTYLVDNFCERHSWHDPKAVVQVFEALCRGDARDYLAAYTRPTLIINGEFDGARPKGEKTASLIPGSHHQVLAGCGHACMIEDPAAFDAVVIEFLKEYSLMPQLPGEGE